MQLSAKASVLRSLFAAKGAFVSGNQLGRELGISRVSVWNHLDALKEEGFRFEAIRNRGYRIVEEPLAFHPDGFAARLALQPCPFFKSYLYLPETGSTNDVAANEFASGREAPFFVISDNQRSGRGRRGRAWYSPPARNLYLSIGLRPELPPTRLQSITLWLGLQISQKLRQVTGLPVMVKWPNDLYLHGRKLAGILTEARVDSEQTRELVVGIGLNINTQAAEFPPELAASATSLAIASGRSWPVVHIAAELLQALATAIEAFLENHYAERLLLDWPEHDYLRDRTIQHEQAEGRVIGIHPNGSLRIQRPDGSVAVVHSGEVGLA